MAFYNSLKIIQHTDSLLAASEGRVADVRPLHVHIEPTESCNCQCSFCWWHDTERKKEILPVVDMTGKRSLNAERLTALIDELADLGCKAISFTGAGDPLVYPRMEQVLTRVIERGIQFGMTSNLAMPLTDSLIELLVQARWVRCSINAGSMETYLNTQRPRNKGGEKVFDRLLGNIRRIAAARARQATSMKFNASYVVCDGNASDVYNAAILASELGFDCIFFRPDMSLWREDKSLEYPKTVHEAIERASQELSGGSFKVFSGEERLSDIVAVEDPELVCYYSNHQTYVAATGDVYPCCYTRFDASYSMGSILDRTFGDFWNSPERLAHYQKLEMSRCPSCPHQATNSFLKKVYQGDQTIIPPASLPAAAPDYFV